jgi:hypothetical protein
MAVNLLQVSARQANGKYSSILQRKVVSSPRALLPRPDLKCYSNSKSLHGHLDKTPYWQKIGVWEDVSEADFLTYGWQVNEYREKRTLKCVNIHLF